MKDPATMYYRRENRTARIRRWGCLWIPLAGILLLAVYLIAHAR